MSFKAHQIVAQKVFDTKLLLHAYLMTENLTKKCEFLFCFFFLRRNGMPVICGLQINHLYIYYEFSIGLLAAIFHCIVLPLVCL